MKKTALTALALASFGIGAAQAALVAGDFSGGITSTGQVRLDLDDGVLDSGWYSHDSTFTVSSGVATTGTEQFEGNMVSQVFTNSQTGSGTLTFDYAPATGQSVNYYVVGWNGTDLTSSDGVAAYINTDFSTAGPDFPNNGSVNLVTGTATGDTTSTAFDISGYSQIGVVFWQPDAAGSGAGSTLDNVVLTAVPEPSSTALLGLAGLALMLRRRR